MTDFPASASLSAAALHLLLATHPELDDLPFTWVIDEDRTLRPSITVGHDRGEESVRLLAAALELPVQVFHYGTDEEPMQSLSIGGRWGGATFDVTAYVKAAR